MTMNIMERIALNKLLDDNFNIMSSYENGGLLTAEMLDLFKKTFSYHLEHEDMVDVTLHCLSLLRSKYDYNEITYNKLIECVYYQLIDRTLKKN